MIYKIAESIIKKLIRQKWDIDKMQFAFMPRCGTTNAIFISGQLTGKIPSINEFVLWITSFGKSFWSSCSSRFEESWDSVPRDVAWWAFRKLGLE